VVFVIKKFTYRDFKSFEAAEFYTESFTTLIGTNASGKSNAIEGIRILSDISNGIDLSIVLDGSKSETVSGIRGGSKGCCRFNSDSFALGCTIILDNDFDLEYEVRIEVLQRVYIREESLYKVRKADSNRDFIFKTKEATKGSGDIKVEYNNQKQGGNKPIVWCNRSSAILPQIKTKLPSGQIYKDYINCIETVITDLKNILFLDPVPSEMRDYVRATDIELKPTGSNISAVLKQLCNNKEKEKQFLNIIKSLPENEITDISFIDTALGDVIFALNEKYGNKIEEVDAKRLSDGTLRCVAIVTAILTETENSMIIIEEIDNGIHPGRAQCLIDSISNIGRDRKIDVILTTHNAALLNGLSRDNLAGVVIAYREEKGGTSKFQSFIDINDYARILMRGLGDSVIDDSLIHSIKKPKNKKVNLSWMEVSE
jgi:predicted ATPase